MKSILKTFADWKAKRKAKAEKLERERIEYEKQSKLNAENKLILITEEMTNKPCAVNNMENCSKTCVHFQVGFVYNTFSDFGGGAERFFYAVSPYCKLWSKK